MEKMDVYDINGNLTGQIKTRRDVFEPGEYRLVASLWIVSPEGMLLIQKRSPEKEYAPDKWSITGGAVLCGETSVQGCLREVREEIGLSLNESDVALLRRSLGENLIYDDFVTVCDFDTEKALLQPEEVSEIKWVTIGQLRHMFQAGEFMFESMEEIEQIERYISENIGRTINER